MEGRGEEGANWAEGGGVHTSQLSGFIFFYLIFLTEVRGKIGEGANLPEEERRGVDV